MWLFEKCQHLGLKLIGMAHDGDARCRKAEWELNFHNRMKAPQTTLDHPLMFLNITYIYGLKVLSYQDWMHLSAFRCRWQLCDATHNFQFGNDTHASGSDLRPWVGSLFNEKDLDYHEKQHYQGCLKIFSAKTIHTVQTKMESSEHAGEGQDLRGIFAFLVFGCRLLQCSVGSEAQATASDPNQAAIDAAFCCGFVLYWQWLIVSHAKLNFTLKKHFITRETFLDILTLTHTSIVLIILYRDDPDLAKWKIHHRAVSSCISEYTFQQVRMGECNSPLFDVAGFRWHLKHLLQQMEQAAQGLIEFPDSKRGVPKTIKNVADM